MSGSRRTSSMASWAGKDGGYSRDSYGGGYAKDGYGKGGYEVRNVILIPAQAGVERSQRTDTERGDMK
jgi:hypothetical protein